MRNRFVSRHSANFRQSEEAGLENRVNARSHAGFDTDFSGVDNVELGFLGDQVFLNLDGQMIPNFVRTVLAVEQERAAFLKFGKHVDLFDELPLVAADERRAGNEVRTLDRARAETKV